MAKHLPVYNLCMYVESPQKWNIKLRIKLKSMVYSFKQPTGTIGFWYGHNNQQFHDLHMGKHKNLNIPFNSAIWSANFLPMPCTPTANLCFYLINNFSNPYFNQHQSKIMHLVPLAYPIKIVYTKSSRRPEAFSWFWYSPAAK